VSARPVRRPDASTITDEQLDQLYRDLDQARRTAGGLNARVADLGRQLHVAESELGWHRQGSAAAAVARARTLAAEMRTWASPKDLVHLYADRLDAALSGTDT
jgi:hypothetical protein